MNLASITLICIHAKFIACDCPSIELEKIEAFPGIQCGKYRFWLQPPSHGFFGRVWVPVTLLQTGSFLFQWNLFYSQNVEPISKLQMDCIPIKLNICPQGWLCRPYSIWGHGPSHCGRLTARLGGFRAGVHRCGQRSTHWGMRNILLFPEPTWWYRGTLKNLEDFTQQIQDRSIIEITTCHFHCGLFQYYRV